MTYYMPERFTTQRFRLTLLLGDITHAYQVPQHMAHLTGNWL